jgi:hypothetical protein
MILDMDTPCIHGIAIFDAAGNPISRVQSLDTDTLLCRCRADGRDWEVTAAGYLFVFVGQKSFQRAKDYFPADVNRFFYLHEDVDTLEKAYKRYISELLESRK